MTTTNRIEEISNELTVITLDAREVLYNFAGELSDNAKRTICILSSVHGGLEMLKEYVEVIGYEEVVRRAEALLSEAERISQRLTEEITKY